MTLMLTRSDFSASAYMYCTNEGCWILQSPGSHPSSDSGEGIDVSRSASAGRYDALVFPRALEAIKKARKKQKTGVIKRTADSIRILRDAAFYGMLKDFTLVACKTCRKAILLLPLSL